MKRVMENDGGKPKNTLPVEFRPGGQPVEGTVVLTRDGVDWLVLGVDAYDRRIFARRGENTVWIECGAPEEIHEMQSDEPVEVVCGCVGGSTGFGFCEELGLWVHADCRKPKRLYLDTLVQRLLDGELV